MFKCINNFGSVFPFCLDCRISMIKFLTHISHFPAVFYLLYLFNFSFDAQNFFFCMGGEVVVVVVGL